jgi:hypothetical protein
VWDVRRGMPGHCAVPHCDAFPARTSTRLLVARLSRPRPRQRRKGWPARCWSSFVCRILKMVEERLHFGGRRYGASVARESTYGAQQWTFNTPRLQRATIAPKSPLDFIFFFSIVRLESTSWP